MEGVKVDYRKYRFSKKELMVCFLKTAGICMVIAYLCYRSVFAMALFPLLFWVLLRKERQQKLEQRKERLSLEFKETMQAVAGALTAGYSIENALKEAQKEIHQLYGENSYMEEELAQMNAKIGLNQPLEELFMDFSNRSGVEEVESFCQVFVFAKRGGGDFVKIIKTTVDQISDKLDIKREIAIMIASRKLEQKIMQAVPVFILFYLDLTSPEFLQVLYHNSFGNFMMTICLLLYMVAILLAEKIINISV